MTEPTTPIFAELCRAFEERGAHHPEAETIEQQPAAEEDECLTERRPA